MLFRRLLILGGTHLAAIAIGLAIGWYFGMKARRYVDMVSNVGTVGARSLHLDVLRREGSVYAYRDALLANPAFLEQVQEDDDPFLTRPVIQGDSVLILARLARIEDALGREGESNAYVDRAVQACLRISWKRCDAENILRLSEQMETQMERNVAPANAEARAAPKQAHGADRRDLQSDSRRLPRRRLMRFSLDR